MQTHTTDFLILICKKRPNHARLGVGQSCGLGLFWHMGSLRRRHWIVPAWALEKVQTKDKGALLERRRK